ncbi:PadR family transcriptional regulator, partial [Burkholderia sp. Ax-1735]|nr:PadR family transcriptional regulator [Burkholderia sp. Ax-1735]
MSPILLLVLGAVRRHGRAHGYQVRNDLDYWGALQWANASPGSIYHGLKQMGKEGLLLADESAASPAGETHRNEYEITEQGTEEYLTLLRSALVSYDQGMDVLSAGIGFIVDLERADA